MIRFNVPPLIGGEKKYLEQVLANRKFCGDGDFTRRCQNLIEQKFGTKRALLTTSCTHALEMAGLLCDFQPREEVIMPSFTFVSTANAFALHAASPVFIDIRPETMNLDERLIEDAVTPRTRAIVCMHYAGVACRMDRIMEIAGRHGLAVIEDAAQGVMAQWNGRFHGTIGHIGCYSFHETKNYTSGEGGALLINDEKFRERAEIIREKGTNRSRFLRGEVDKYTWVDLGSSYLPSELNAAFLLAQLEQAETLNSDRLASWQRYFTGLKPLEDAGKISLPFIPDCCVHNAHMFYIKTADLAERTALTEHLKQNGVQAVFHYVPLHSSVAGMKYGRFHGTDRYTTRESERLLRLPLYYGMTPEDCDAVIEAVTRFYRH
ncbi:MAG: dTDP-4-amino-4,6-dideoxygalactose transaminase [Candidatus Wallbacteria bacterium]|nr:dTDP-4-amino-4,6-dideoxygalactose transaminase [Candidatus Wallbacteria bacterium]